MNNHARGHNIVPQTFFSKWLLRGTSIVLLLFVSVFYLNVGMETALAAPSPTGATISSDQADYPPGATVTLSGTGWASNESVHIFVNDDSAQTWTLNSNPDPVADASGAFTYTFQLPNYFVANYSAAATGPTSGTATTTFTDANIGTYDQCSNDTGGGYASGDTGCRWINGNLQHTNSTYVEGDATPQRLWLTDFTPGTSHTVTFSYGTTKGGKHAYDFLTTFNFSETWITLADRCETITGCTTASETMFAIPHDPLVPVAYESVADPRQFVMRGGTITAVSVPTLVSGSYGGDSETQITVTFTADSSGSMCHTKNSVTTCDVAVWFGAHVAAQANWGVNTGAGSISGSPYHVALVNMDGGSIGSRDNQMQSDSVSFTPNGTITIIKDAVPNSAQDFTFTLTNNSTISQNFSLDDDSDPTLPNSQNFSVPPGTWSATETNIAGGWNLSTIVCQDPTNDTTVSEPTALINLASGETVTCTFTNTSTPQSAYLSSFKVKAARAGAKLTWQTVNELNVIGFNVWRSSKLNGKYVQLNSAAIANKYPGQLVGGKYNFTDKTAKAGKTYYYKIQVLGTGGTLEWSDIKKFTRPAQ